MKIDASPLIRLRQYLLNGNLWREIDENSWFLEQHPEFTITPTKEEVWEIQAGDNWVRAAINSSAYVRPMAAKFHQTVIAKVTCIYFDEMRQMIPAPKPTSAESYDDEYFYSFNAETFDFLFLQFFSKKNRRDLIEKGIICGRTGKMPIVIFSSILEEKSFLEYLKTTPVKILSAHQFNRNDPSSKTTENDKKVITYSRAVIEHFETWKAALQS